MDRTVKAVRIYVHEAEHGRRAGLVREILTALKSAPSVRNVIVFRGVAGYDEAGEVHAADTLRSIVNLPEAIEFFDAPEDVDKTLALLKDVVPDGRIVIWDAVRR